MVSQLLKMSGTGFFFTESSNFQESFLVGKKVGFCFFTEKRTMN